MHYQHLVLVHIGLQAISAIMKDQLDHQLLENDDKFYSIFTIPNLPSKNKVQIGLTPQRKYGRIHKSYLWDISTLTILLMKVGPNVFLNSNLNYNIFYEQFLIFHNGSLRAKSNLS